ncbi:MAG: hypothetical protein ACYCW6_18265 [Candidatus Xenobia bacterium]
MTALEMYADDHGHVCPTSLAALVLNYLKVTPTCPAGGRYQYQVAPHAYTVTCRGSAHRDEWVMADHPIYASSVQQVDVGQHVPTLLARFGLFWSGQTPPR